MRAHSSDFRSIRSWRGSQHQAFEELCYQLRDKTLDDLNLVKTGSPDAGFEWYVTQKNGDQWGWQVKFTFEIESLLKLMEESLKTVIKKRPRCLKLTFCIPFDLSDVPQNGERRAARQKFEDRKDRWRGRIHGANEVEVKLCAEGELLERLVSHPSSRGIEWFFWDKEVFSPDWCARRQQVAAQAAGKRYSPELHVDLPVAFSLEGLALSEAYWQRFRTLRGEVCLTTARLVKISHHDGLGVPTLLEKLARSLEEWRREVPKCVELPRRLNQKCLLEVTHTCLGHVQAAHWDDPPQPIQGKTKKHQSCTDETRRYLLYCLDKLDQALSDFEDLLQSSATSAAAQGALLLTGEAGQGKTHLFCDVVQRAVAADQPAIVLFGGHFSGRNLWSDIESGFGLSQIGSEALIGGMQAAAEASNAPFLILIDALNEAEKPKDWQEILPSLLAEVDQKPWISLGVSIRSSYLQLVLPPDDPLPNLTRVEHPGFAKRELEATEQFFDGFGLEQPRVPLLAPEFTNPLFLKLYCEGLQEKGWSAADAGGTHISGVFDRYLERKERQIASRLDLDCATGPVKAAVDAFSKGLADKNSLAYGRSEQIINEFASHLHKWPDTLFGQLLSEGVLSADPDASGRGQVVRFTYQRFADYRAVSRLLEPLNGDPAHLCKALAVGKPLHRKVLKAPAGWIEALSVQIPEQFNVELLNAAQWQLDSSTRLFWSEAFVRSIAARSPSAIAEGSCKLLSRVRSQSPDLIGLVIETLLEVAPSPRHPLNANTLHDILMGQSMPERDVAWSIPTYYAWGKGGALDRLIRWSARGPHPGCSNEVIELVAIPLVWTFTSPNRKMRDYATKALVKILFGRLSVLLRLIQRFDRINDPYVLERLAVVAQGAVFCGGSEAPDAAVAIAEELKRVVLAEEQIPNIITRDALCSIYEWCARARQDQIADHVYAEVLPPYSSAPPQGPRTMEQLESAFGRDCLYGGLFRSIFSSLSGDFGRYKIEANLGEFSQYRLSSARGRSDKKANYPPETGRRWVFERVLSLGWTPERFYEFERHLVTQAWREASGGSPKSERFGKKYQWIALRELLARVADNFCMMDISNGLSMKPRTYMGPWQFFGRDIDPTLPVPTLKHSEGDGFELNPTFISNDEGWWTTPGPSYRRDDPPVNDDWATESDDIPEFEPLVKKEDECGTCWVVLRACYDWNDEVAEDEEKWSRRHRNLWSQIYSWLFQPTDNNGVVRHLEQLFEKEQVPASQSFQCANAYLGELPWAKAANEYPESWHDIWPPYGLELVKSKIFPTSGEYLWEHGDLDCSLKESVPAWFPAPTLFKGGELSWEPGTRKWRRSDGTIAARYLEERGHSALLVREDWLKQTLQKTGHSIMFGWFGGKRLLDPEPPYIVGGRMQINAIASFAGTQWTFGKWRLKCHSASE